MLAFLTKQDAIHLVIVILPLAYIIGLESPIRHQIKIDILKDGSDERTLGAHIIPGNLLSFRNNQREAKTHVAGSNHGLHLFGGVG
ncbi:hypothetical protein BC941DRAFT_469419 [Chlamydoabsidia padenii]|nr:hypothetical protein BC941DRAFT_469419 [Chlamydoabsidia padenii]